MSEASIEKLKEEILEVYNEHKRLSEFHKRRKQYTIASFNDGFCAGMIWVLTKIGKSRVKS